MQIVLTVANLHGTAFFPSPARVAPHILLPHDRQSDSPGSVWDIAPTKQHIRYIPRKNQYS
jgi:hypothetical protein